MSLLPSWHLTPTRQAILDFVADVTNPRHPDFVDRASRIAVFDDDGTLWPDCPMSLQCYFLIDQIQALAPKTPAVANRQPFRALLEQDYVSLQTVSKPDLLALFDEIHAGLTPEECAALAQDWWGSAIHPHLGRPVGSCYFQPMQDLLAYLTEHGFVPYILTSGSLDFARVAAAVCYGLPPERVIGNSPRTRLKFCAERADLVNLASLGSIAPPEEAVNVLHRHLGRRPVLAAGNGLSDLAVLRYTASGPGRRLTLLINANLPSPIASVNPAPASLMRRSPPGVLPADLPRGGLMVEAERDFSQPFPTVAVPLSAVG
ncbi:HAD family hydrolase [Nodosilinea sp. E11]|uniref:HAD family hydrolase n=1 Tax=Nodosilinea sp. E11 TaxID=3037479 RepID=UPI0029345FF4|nr:HAD family hydrolase [Nodosilinea sp. E11]WOD37566.1 HAD family hydrolase [Nodosilinea sp. E11]